MSVASEITRLQQAKSDLATSIAAKGVTVPAATTLDGYAALVDQIQQGGGGTLPYDAEIEYLQSDTNAYINTGIKVSGDLYVKTYLVDGFTSANLGKWPFGSRDGGTSNVYGLFINGNTGKVTCVYYNAYTAYNSYTSYPQSCWVVMQSGCIKIGTTTHIYTARSFTAANTLFLFGLNNEGSLIGQGQYKIGTTIISNGTTTLYLIPVRVGQVGYMYDKISGQMFGNANSTGAFILGPDVT